MFSLLPLLLASIPIVVAQDKKASDYFVKSLPGAPDGPLLKMHAGHVQVNEEHHGNLFFWHYQNRHIGDKQRTVIWLNGGPGCSSMDGAMMEIGPYRVLEDGNLTYNNGSWDEFANLLFVDNPVGTGFSYVDTNAYLHELQEMADQMVTFLDKFFAIFPQYENDDLYLAGESYAGQHIPYIAKAILDRNKENQANQWKLAGQLIGNGWISGPDQYPSYLKYAYQEGLIKADTDAARAIEAQQAVCQKDLSNGGSEHVDAHSCEQILNDILASSQDKSASEDKRCVNMYDVRKRDNYPSCGMNWPPDLATVTPYLRRRDVTSALHINPEKRTAWQECTGAVSDNFRARNSAPAIKLLPGIIEQVPTILFSGDKDLICNHIGTENLIHNMAWGGGTGFELSPGTWAPRQAWTFDNEPAGYYQSARNLTYIVFYNSSHMVPFDYPRRTRDMLDRFMGVDIGSIGGTPGNSRIDGEKGLETSVGGHPNSTAAEEAEKQKLSQAQWDAYYRAGEVALVVVAIAAAAFGYYVWRDRQSRQGYTGLDKPISPGGMLNGALRNNIPGMDGYRSEHSRSRDLEAADFDEAELDNVDKYGKKVSQGQDHERYSLGSLSDDEGVGSSSRAQGKGYKDNEKSS